MQEVTLREAAVVSGGGAIGNFIAGKIAGWILDQVIAGNVDYSSIAEQQGTYYNTVGA